MVTMSQLDSGQVIKSSYNPNGSLNVTQIAAGLVPATYDSIALTYVASGNGVGQIATVKYYNGGLSGTLIRTLTMTYDGSNNLIDIVGT